MNTKRIWLVVWALVSLAMVGCGAEEAADTPSADTPPTGTQEAEPTGDLVVQDENGDTTTINAAEGTVVAEGADGEGATVSNDGTTAAVVDQNGDGVVQDEQGTSAQEGSEAAEVANDGTTVADDGRDRVVIDPTRGIIDVGGIRIGR